MNLQKQVHKVCKNKSSFVADKNSTCKTVYTKKKGEFFVNSSNNYENKNCLQNNTEQSNSNQCLKTNEKPVDSSAGSPGIGLVDFNNVTTDNGFTESYSCRDLLCHVVEQEKIDFFSKNSGLGL